MKHSTTSPGPDVNAEAKAPLISPEDSHNARFSQAIFGLSPTEATAWPGLQAYILHVRGLAETLGPSWILLALPTLPTSRDHTALGFNTYADFLMHLASVFKDHETPNKPSIDDIARVLHQKRDDGTNITSPEVIRPYRRAIFCGLAWVTILMEVLKLPVGDSFEAVFPGDGVNLPPPQPLDNARRPICSLIRGFC
jgi:hypothetical protein